MPAAPPGPTPGPDEPVGRRAANRQRTRSAIIESVRELAQERGLAALTVDEVAERAEVSRRTFHNYFPNVHAVVGAALVDVFRPIGDRFLDRPVGEHPLESARAVLRIDDDVLAWMTLVPDAADGVALKIQMESDHQLTAWLEDLLRRRLGPAVIDDGVYPRMLTATVHGAFEAAQAAWSEQTGRGTRPGDKQVFQETLDRALALAASGFTIPHDLPTRPTPSGETNDPSGSVARG